MDTLLLSEDIMVSFSNNLAVGVCRTVNIVHRPIPDMWVDKESSKCCRAKTSPCNHNTLLHYGPICDSLPHFATTYISLFSCFISSIGEMYGDFCLFWTLMSIFWLEWYWHLYIDMLTSRVLGTLRTYLVRDERPYCSNPLKVYR